MRIGGTSRTAFCQRRHLNNTFRSEHFVELHCIFRRRWSWDQLVMDMVYQSTCGPSERYCTSPSCAQCWDTDSKSNRYTLLYGCSPFYDDSRQVRDVYRYVKLQFSSISFAHTELQARSTLQVFIPCRRTVCVQIGTRCRGLTFEAKWYAKQSPLSAFF